MGCVKPASVTDAVIIIAGQCTSGHPLTATWLHPWQSTACDAVTVDV